ncbi:MAG: MBL fold metallo-hydrolase [Candidatus Vogelbacteria bacterium]|nr:MBL fold metallo-hydrolase [Candidatus Vogelbacteria bacterium]
MAVLFLLNFFIWYVAVAENRRGLLKIAVLDIGQGDAIFIEAPNGNQVLIDGGPGEKILNRLTEQMPFYDRSIDLLILTHPHVDHLDGLLAVLKRYQIGAVIESEVEYPLAAYVEWRRLLKEQGVKVILARAGETVRLDNHINLEILAPIENFISASPTNVHDSMVVSRLTYASTTALLTGDMEMGLERELMASGVNLKSDLLKVGHHGSKTSTTEAFLRAVAPQFAVISVGAHNRYGHPAQATIDTLTAAGVKIFRTDEAGTLIFASDGQHLTANHR